MTKFTFGKAAAVVAIAATATFGLAACSSSTPEPANSESAIGGDIVAPIELDYQDIEGQTVQLVPGQVININYGGINEGEITVDISDKLVIEYSPSKMVEGTQYSAGLAALSAGESTATFNFNGGDPKVLNVQVLVK